VHRPRLKTVFTPIPLTDGSVCLGMPRTPRSATIADPEGIIRETLVLLDGTRSVADIANESSIRISRQDLERLVDTLTANGFLEDASAEPPVDLTDREVRRYSRNSEFFSYFSDAGPSAPSTRYSPQVALKKSTIAVLGVGGLGSHVATHLAALGIGQLLLLDFDTVEESNLNRQLLFTDADIGRSKVIAAAERLAAINPLVKVIPTEGRINGPADAAEFLNRADLTICAADRPRVDLDRWINAAALQHNRPWMRGASVGLTAALDLFVPGQTSCAECRLRTDEDSEADAEFVEQIRNLGDITVSPCISPVAGMLGALAAWEATKFLTGLAPTPLLENQIVIDVPNAEIHHLPDPRMESCPVCSTSTAAEGRDGDYAFATGR
jgi:molybdopterin/thiamine biosynthesis adenylyltransferase